MHISYYRLAIGLLAVTCAFWAGVLYDTDKTATVPAATVSPMPNAWQVLIVAPGKGNPSKIVSYGKDIPSALIAAGELATDYRKERTLWVAGKTCIGEGLRRTCNAVREK